MQDQLKIFTLITPILDTLKLTSDEIKSFLQIGIPEYLQNQTDKYYFTNTFLHRAEKVKFDDIYFPISVKYNLLETKFKNLKETFEEYKCITIIGSAGSGKSTLIKYIFLNSIRQSFKIPVLIELRHLNDYQGTLIDFLSEKLLSNQLKPSKSTLERALNKGGFLFLLDGYDEIFSKSKQKITKELHDFVDKYPNNKFIISTRPGSGIEGTPRFHSFHVQDLTNKEITNFIDLLVTNKERASQIKANIHESRSSDYSDYLKNPLLLSMFILAFESHPEIPDRKSAFYKNVFDTLYSKHDGITKGSFPREKKTKLKREDFEEILSALSFLTISEGHFAFTEEYLSAKLNLINRKKSKIDFEIEKLIFDLRTSISIMIKDGFEYKFPHRSMQEYFASLFLSNLPSDKKEKAYKKLNVFFKRLSEDRSFNFWGLCKELDYDSYINFFVLPELTTVVTKLKGKEGIDLLNDFFHILDPDLIFGIPTTIDSDFSTKKNLKGILISRRRNLHNVLIDFEQIYNFKNLAFFLNRPGAKEKIFPSLKRTKSKIDIIHDIRIKKILIEFGICDIINNYVNKIEERINYYKESLEQRNEDLDDLLES